jgi:hypothetical protein
VWDRGLHQRHRTHITPRTLRRLADRIGNTARLADPQTNLATVISHNRNHTEVEATSAFDDFRHPRDVYDALVQFLSLFEDLAIS